MLTLRHLLSLPAFLSTAIIAHALAASDGFIDADQNGVNVDFAAQLTGGEKCDDMDMKAIREGFKEMNMLFQAAMRVDWNGEAELEFFGMKDRIQNYTGMIESNLIRAAQYGNLNGNTTRNPDIHVRCDDPNDLCDEGNKKDGKHTAYNIGNEPHINFCDRYFDLDPLEDKVDKEAGNQNTRRDIMQYYNRATIWARQVMHFSAVGTAVVQRPVLNSQSNSTSMWTIRTSQGAMNTSVLAGVMNARPKTKGPNDIQTFKYAYGATRAKLIAKMTTQAPYDAANNAENYALYAQARFVMARKDFFPNQPVIQFDNEMTVLANEQLQDGGEKRYACYDDPDVVSRKMGTNSIGAPIRSSSAPSLFKRKSRWINQAAFAVYWTLAWYILLSILG